MKKIIPTSIISLCISGSIDDNFSTRFISMLFPVPQTNIIKITDFGLVEKLSNTKNACNLNITIEDKKGVVKNICDIRDKNGNSLEDVKNVNDNFDRIFHDFIYQLIGINAARINDKEIQKLFITFSKLQCPK